MRIYVQVEGDAEMLHWLDQLGVRGLNAGKRAVQRVVDRIAVKARALAPDDPSTGAPDLRTSIRSYASRSRTRGTISGGVVAGGRVLEPRRGKRKAGVIYRVVIHEDPHSPGYKFIERPAMDEVQKFPGELLQELNRELGRG